MFLLYSRILENKPHNHDLDFKFYIDFLYIFRFIILPASFNSYMKLWIILEDFLCFFNLVDFLLNYMINKLLFFVANLPKTEKISKVTAKTWSILSCCQPKTFLKVSQSRWETLTLTHFCESKKRNQKLGQHRSRKELLQRWSHTRQKDRSIFMSS